MIAGKKLAGKHLTEHPMLGGVDPAEQSPRPKGALPYINWYINGYGPAWTSLGSNRRYGPASDEPARSARSLLLRDRKVSSPSWARPDVISNSDGFVVT